MKKVIILAVSGVLSFIVSAAGIYLAMPTIAPAVVDSTRVRLDSLGLLPLVQDEPATTNLKNTVKPVPFDTSSNSAVADSANSLRAQGFLPGSGIDTALNDSLQRTTNLVTNLEHQNAALNAHIEELTMRIDKLRSQRADAEELSKSLSKLEDRQLAAILLDLDLNVVEMLYLQASIRDRPRLLQNLPPDRAARFVKTLVKAPASTDDVEAIEDTSNQAGESNP